MSLENRKISKTISEFNKMIVDLFKERATAQRIIVDQENEISDLKYTISELLEEIENTQNKLLFYSQLVESEEVDFGPGDIN